MSDEVSARRIPRACEIEGCERAPELIVELIEMSGAVMNDLFVCADHEAEARASL